MDRNINDQLHESYSDSQNLCWTQLNTTGQVLSIFELASQTGLAPAAVKSTLAFLEREGLVESDSNGDFHSLPGVVCEAGE